jgi:hypothetical protein
MSGCHGEPRPIAIAGNGERIAAALINVRVKLFHGNQLIQRKTLAERYYLFVFSVGDSEYIFADETEGDTLRDCRALGVNPHPAQIQKAGKTQGRHSNQKIFKDAHEFMFSALPMNHKVRMAWCIWPSVICIKSCYLPVN